jgi:hypothetical protein
VSTEPKRLRTGSDALAASVTSLQQALPSDERMAALAERLARAGAPVETPARLDAPAPRSELRMIRAAKRVGPETLTVLAALLFGAGLITMVLFHREADSPPTSLPAPPQPATPTPAAATPAARAPTAAGPADTSTALPSPASARAPVAAATPPPEPPAAAVSSAPVAAAQQGMRTAAAEPTPPTRPTPRYEGRALAPSGRARPTTVEPANEGAPLAASTVVETEIELLKQARSALGADPLQAFALSERCRAQYPNGAFAQEREYIAISALVRLGRTSDARSRASLFRMHYPNSAYLPRLTRMLGE